MLFYYRETYLCRCGNAGRRGAWTGARWWTVAGGREPDHRRREIQSLGLADDGGRRRLARARPGRLRRRGRRARRRRAAQAARAAVPRAAARQTARRVHLHALRYCGQTKEA